VVTVAASFAELHAAVLEELTTALAGDWWIAPSAPLDAISKPTLYAVRTQISKAGQSQGFLLNTFSVYLIFPTDMAETAIDEAVQTAQQVLDASENSGRWTEANRVIFGNPGNPAWQFDFLAQSTRNAT
jgi:hypothetical protein